MTTMKLASEAFRDGTPIPAEFAFGKPDAAAHMSLSSNRSPPLAWSGVPAGAKSFVLLCHDPDVPTKPDDVNQEHRRVPATLPRFSFFHWVLVDLPPSLTSLPAGWGSDGIKAGGKPGPQAQAGRHGVNDYGVWFAGDANMKGDYYGYDGPCPPWNDTIVHHYWFTIYALDVDHLAVGDKATGNDVLAAMKGHILAEAKTMGTYSLAPDVKA
jgi:Raf kinase inhibitor-like YbhB/YbcL family protein